MKLQHTLQECRIDSVLESIGITSNSAKKLFKEQAEKWTTNLDILQARSNGWNSLKQSDSSLWDHHLSSLLKNETLLREMDPSTATESQKEGWSQILFTGEFSSLNFVPFVLIYVAISKIVIAPLIAWCMPIMTIILPYLALRFLYNLPITWDAYWRMMKPMIFGGGGRQMNIITLLQWGSMFVSYAHGLYIPYTNAKHCYKIDQLMIKGAKAVIDTIKRLRDIADIWVKQGLRKPWSFLPPETYGDERQIIAWIQEDSHFLPQIYRAIGQVEITYAIQKCESLVPVEWIQYPTPLCKMVNAVDPLLLIEQRVPFTLIMGKGEHHSVCTGPNRGGKSTFLRSVLTNLIFAHSWGVAFAERCILSPVEWVISSLRLEDRPGKESLFEREVNVAGDILKRIRQKDTRGWVIIDELFHTTNPPDAATASQTFLQQLWQSQLTTSIVSTHLFLHAEYAPPHVQRLCVESEADDMTDKIKYTYRVVHGINKMSSVEELLVESKVLIKDEMRVPRV